MTAKRYNHASPDILAFVQRADQGRDEKVSCERGVDNDDVVSQGNVQAAMG